MKTIVALLFALGLLLANLLSFAQSKSDKIYDIFSNEPGVSSFTFSKRMIDAVDIDLGENGDERNVTGDLHEVRFMSYNPEKGSRSNVDFIKKAIALLPSSYNKHKECDDDTEIWLLGKRKKFTECHVFIKSDGFQGNCFLVSFYGSFKVNDIEKLAEKGKEISE